MNPQQQATSAGEPGRQYLTFTLGTEEFGFDLLKVHEIRGYSPTTPIPNAPAHVRGVMNLRGAVVPVIGLREKFGMASVEYDKFTVIVVVSVATRVMGLIVDAVSDVMSVGPESIEPPPELGSEVDTSYMTGMAKLAGRLVILIDIEKMLGATELERAVQGAGEGTRP